jgi:dipeptidyl aminopeptidase/acylaminoacyl peptidase
MLMRRALFVLCCLCLMGMAQAKNTPLIMFVNGDAWAWDETSGSLRQMTTWGYNYQPALSPDGARIAYVSFAEITVDAIRRDSEVLARSPLPSNLWILDIATGNGTRAADEPPDAVFRGSTPENAFVRSKAAWSPDGKQLAWTETFYPGGKTQLTVYDVAALRARTIATDLPEQKTGAGTPMALMWGTVGILVESVTENPKNSRGDKAFLVYSPEGGLISTIPVPETPDRAMTEAILLVYEGHEYIGVRYVPAYWALLDPLTGKVQAAPGVPELYSTAAPDRSILVSMTPGTDGNPDTAQLRDSQGQPLAPPIPMGYGAMDRLVLSPDGQAAAYTAFQTETSVFERAIRVWRDGKTVEVPAVDAVHYVADFVWGPTAWRIVPANSRAICTMARVWVWSREDIFIASRYVRCPVS